MAAFLRHKASLSIHKRKIKNFKRRSWIVPGPFHTLTADLIDYQQYSRKNNGFKYILVCVDAFSRFAHTAPLRNKTALTTAIALDNIMQSLPFPPTFFVTDKE